MKSILYSAIILLTLFSMSSCTSDDDDRGQYLVAVPVYENMNTYRNDIQIDGPQSTSSDDGKIYVTANHLFYIAQEAGVHIFDNSDPANPVNTAFIEIPGVHDIAIKDNYLYADNFMDLTVFDISNLDQIEIVQTVENSVTYYPELPDTEYIDWNSEGYESGDFLVGYRMEYRHELPQMEWLSEDGGDPANYNGGQGGSFAKFQINNNALYTADSWKINVFNISEPENTSYVNYFYPETWVGEFETMYKLKNYLFIGSTQGMAVYDATNEFSLQYVSAFSHATGCDPVVAKDNFAYLTIRGGNFCGATESQVNVIGIEDIINPYLVSAYLLDEPYGIGIHDTTLFVGTGENGLKIFDASNPAELVLMNEMDINTYDVIPLTESLILVGGGTVTQFSYGENYTLNEISSISF